MSTKQEQRSEETKRAILTAAGKLFSQQGFDYVTMREIAKKAHCSHTTIYIYFKDKEALLHELSMPALLTLKQTMNDILLQQQATDEDKLRGISHAFIRLCLLNRNMYRLFFVTKATRVDGEEPATEMNKLRLELFELLLVGLQRCLHIQPSDDRLLGYGRILFYTLHGIIGTYTTSEESYEALSERLQTTFDDAIEVLLLGIQQKMKKEIDRQ